MCSLVVKVADSMPRRHAFNSSWNIHVSKASFTFKKEIKAAKRQNNSRYDLQKQ